MRTASPPLRKTIKLRWIAFLSALMICVLPIVSHAQSAIQSQVNNYAQAVVSQGYAIDEVYRSFFGRYVIIASKGERRRELVIDQNNGILIRDREYIERNTQYADGGSKRSSNSNSGSSSTTSTASGDSNSGGGESGVFATPSAPPPIDDDDDDEDFGDVEIIISDDGDATIELSHDY